jgi:hypothetical protein
MRYLVLEFESLLPSDSVDEGLVGFDVSGRLPEG